MSDFAVVTFRKEGPGDVVKKNWFSRLRRRLEEHFHNKLPVLETVKLEIFNQVTCYYLQLPYTLEELRSAGTRRIKNINDFLGNFLAETGLTHYLLPAELADIHRMEGGTTPCFYGPLLYKALLPVILDSLYNDRGIMASQLDIAIIHSVSRHETLSVIRLLSRQVKYITLITAQKEQFEEELEEIFLDTGLSVRVTGECRNALKNADLIINLWGIGVDGGIPRSAFHTGTSSRTVILNYQPSAACESANGNTMINEVEVALPRSIAVKLQNNLLQYFDQRFLVEMLIFHRLGDLPPYQGDKDFPFLEKVAEIFKKSGFIISGLVGRRNTFKVSEIKLQDS
jgi:hypothetical protein